MKKALLYSIHPEHCTNIFTGRKKREIRKVLPKIEFPCKVYVYETKPPLKLYEAIMTDDRKLGTIEYMMIRNFCKVVGEFTCTGYDKLVHCGTDNRNITLQIVDNNYYTQPITEDYLKMCCLSYKQLDDYSNGGDLYALHITDVKGYGKPKDISEFHGICRLYERGEGCSDNHCPLYEAPSENGECLYDCKGRKPISRPPQSFYYVEEV